MKSSRLDASVTTIGSVLPDYDLTLRVSADHIAAASHAPTNSAELTEAERVLLECGPFADLPAVVRAAVAAELEPIEFQPGETLITQGQPGTGLWLILEGQVEVHILREDAPPQFINSVGPGSVLGEMSLLTRQPATANVRAQTRTLGYRLQRDVFQSLVVRYDVLGQVLTQVIASRLGGAPIDVLAGKVLGSYRIRGRLGRGGMSVVYDANQVQQGTRVALKMMSHRLVYDQRALAAFHREAELIASFVHPHIVRLLDRFESFHTHFIAMEYCDGEDLKSLIARRGALPTGEVRQILGQLAAALDYTHQHGVVHRDIKPSNIMQRASGQILLMDFGLAKASVDASQGGAAIVGTPRYMAPEQLWGQEVTFTADYFAFGCVAYELLTGTPLISVGSVEDLQELHRSWSVEEILVLCPQADPDLKVVLERSLQPNPRHRELALAEIATWA